MSVRRIWSTVDSLDFFKMRDVAQQRDGIGMGPALAILAHMYGQGDIKLPRRLVDPVKQMQADEKMLEFGKHYSRQLYEVDSILTGGKI